MNNYYEENNEKICMITTHYCFKTTETQEHVYPLTSEMVKLKYL